MLYLFYYYSSTQFFRKGQGVPSGASAANFGGELRFTTILVPNLLEKNREFQVELQRRISVENPVTASIVQAKNGHKVSIRPHT